MGGWVQWVGFAGGVHTVHSARWGESGHKELLRGTQRYSVDGGGTGQAAKWAKDGGKLKVAVYGERVIADSGNGLKQGKGSIQGPAFLPMQHISSLHILLMEALAEPFQNKFHRFLDYFHSLSPLVGAESQSGVIRSLLARRLAYYN